MFPISGGVVRFPHLVLRLVRQLHDGLDPLGRRVADDGADRGRGRAAVRAPSTPPFTKSHTVSGETVHTLTGLGYVVAVLAMAFFVVVNYFGIRWFARINNVAVWWKLGVITLVIVAFLVTDVPRRATSPATASRPSGTARRSSPPSRPAGSCSPTSASGRASSSPARPDNPQAQRPDRGHRLGADHRACIYVLLQVAFIAAVRPADLAARRGWAKLGASADDFGPLAAIADRRSGSAGWPRCSTSTRSSRPPTPA